MGMDTREFQKFLGTFEDWQREYEIFLRQFLTEMGLRALAQTKKLTPVDTGDLRRRWELSEVYKEGNYLYIDLINPQDYASHVEDGHWQRSRWVPGKWVARGKKNKFVYDSQAKTGMKLTEKWIPGHYMAKISIDKLQQEIPKRYNKAFKQFLSEMRW